MEIMQWVTWLAGAVVAVGVIEWAKGFAPKAPTRVWRFALPAASIGAAVAARGENPWFDALGVMAISQLGYELIVRRVQKSLGGEAPVSGGSQ